MKLQLKYGVLWLWGPVKALTQLLLWGPVKALTQ